MPGGGISSGEEGAFPLPQRTRTEPVDEPERPEEHIVPADDYDPSEDD
ncbi:MAG: hypothetical protein HOV79_00405 [Hamadaea sp.]|nr:hypothetical protein [Hamadaea sp.]